MDDNLCNLSFTFSTPGMIKILKRSKTNTLSMKNTLTIVRQQLRTCGKSRYRMGFFVPRSLSSPIFPPEIGPRRPGKENRYLFFRCDFLKISLPWCLITVLDGPRAAEWPTFARVCDKMFLEKANFFSLNRSSAAGSAAAFPSFLPPRAILPLQLVSLGLRSLFLKAGTRNLQFTGDSRKMAAVWHDWKLEFPFEFGFRIEYKGD